jgi:uncharacterized membrane protein YhaH (DUF805 family)
MMNYYFEVLGKYADFSGRARRAEYWMFVLINFGVAIVLGIVDAVVGTGVLNALYGLGVLIPSLAVSARRLHDTNRSGWWQLIALVPIIGWVIAIVFYATDSNPGTNKYGPNPKGELETVTA